MGPMKNEKREGASIATFLHRHSYVILHNGGVYLMWYWIGEAPTIVDGLIDTYEIYDQLYAHDLEAHLFLTKALNSQEALWKEEARNRNFMHGDSNASYFHRVAKVRVVSKSMSILQVDDNVLTDPADIEVHILSYFQSIFSVDNF